MVPPPESVRQRPEGTTIGCMEVINRIVLGKCRKNGKKRVTQNNPEISWYMKIETRLQWSASY